LQETTTRKDRNDCGRSGRMKCHKCGHKFEENEIIYKIQGNLDNTAENIIDKKTRNYCAECTAEHLGVELTEKYKNESNI